MNTEQPIDQITRLELPVRHGARVPVCGPGTWHGADFTCDMSWVYQLSKQEVEEIDRALTAMNREAIGPGQLGPSMFPLPELGRRLIALQNEVVDGRGFVLIKGIPVQRYDRRDAAAVFWGVGQYFGTPVSQNAGGHLLGHVTDLGYPLNDSRRRGYQTREGLRYHTDGCDVVGLMCLRRAKTGGLSSICSATAIHNAILESRPDLLEVLYQPFHISRIGEIPAGKLPWYLMPIFNDYAGHLTSMYPARDLRMAQTLEGVPTLSAEQEEALAMVDRYAETLSLKMDIEPGDMQFLHNHTIWHGRTDYEDFDDADQRRHMLRLWLSAPNGRQLPPYFAERYGSIKTGTVRGGILCPGTRLSVPLVLDEEAERD
jgi:hypothetical protein